MLEHPGPLALVGGDEFKPGNQPHDRLLCEAAAGRPAYVLATAARDSPEAAVATARRWFAGLGLAISELRVRTAADARSPALCEQAEAAGFLYIAGGDPGYVARILRGSPVWQAMRAAWRGGAALAGSSAGAMALCRWSLVRAGWPGHTERRPVDALGCVPDSALLPHYDTFGERWIPSAQASLPDGTLLIGVDERTAALWTADAGWSVTGAGQVTRVRGGERSATAAGAPLPGIPAPLS